MSTGLDLATIPPAKVHRLPLMSVGSTSDTPPQAVGVSIDGCVARGDRQTRSTCRIGDTTV
jgi:hypothetical protein